MPSPLRGGGSSLRAKDADPEKTDAVEGEAEVEAGIEHSAVPRVLVELSDDACDPVDGGCVCDVFDDDEARAAEACILEGMGEEGESGEEGREGTAVVTG